MVTLLRAVAQAGARAVHGGVAAADDDDVVADLERLAEVGLLHEVDAVLDAVEVVARDVQRNGVHGAGADGDGVELRLKLLEGDVAPDADAEAEPDAQPLHEPEVHLDGLARQAEGGHADEHRAAAVGQLVEDGDLVAGDGQLTRDGHARRAGADDRDRRVARRDGGHVVGDAAGLVPLRQEALHGADGQRPVDVAAAAGALARRRADVGAHRGDRVGLAREDVALLEAAFSGEVQVARGSSCRRGTLPGTRCCTGARRRRQAEREIPGWDRWPRSDLYGHAAFSCHRADRSIGSAVRHAAYS